jgi:DNA-3-methyladenine glycosylase I
MSMPTTGGGCTWPGSDALMQQYHDQEWGVPVFDDRKLFEYMVLDAFQAGLSWKTILHRREGFRKAFADFDPEQICLFEAKDVERLMADTGIIRNRLKIESTISNARIFLELQKKHGSFSNYIWQFTGGKPKVNAWENTSMIPATSAESDAMSKALKNEGFRFVGSTICYAFMQAAGMINDHLVGCPRWKKLGGKK